MSESIDDLLVTIGGDLSGLTTSFQKTADHIKEMAKAVGGVNFENLVKNGQVVARVIDSLRTQTVKGFGEMAAKTKDVALAVGGVGKQMEQLSGQVQNVSSSLSTLPFARMVTLLEQIATNTRVVSQNFKGLRKDVQLTDNSTSRLETDLHKIIGRLDDLKVGLDKVSGSAGKTAQELGKTGKAGKDIDRIYVRIRGAALGMARDVNKSNAGVVKGMGFLSMSFLSGSRILKAFQHNMVDGLALMSAEFWVLSMAARTAYRAIMYFPTKAIKSVDEFRLSVIKTQALISTFAPKSMDFGIAFKEARDYARGLVSELDLLAAYTLGSSFDLQAITQEFMKQGILLDVNNAKAKEAFLNIANAIEIIASGFQAAELQIRQEARALAMGQVDLRSTLATELNARLGGQLKERVALWKQEGTFIVRTGELLQGYAASLGDIRNTWKSISSLYKTMTDRILRFGSEEFYEKINRKLRVMTDYLQKNENIITVKIYRGWLFISTVVEKMIGAFKQLAPIFEDWGGILKTIMGGLEQFFVAMLPQALNELFRNLTVLYLRVKGTMTAISLGFYALTETQQGNWSFSKTREMWSLMDATAVKLEELTAATENYGDVNEAVGKKASLMQNIMNAFLHTVAFVYTPNTKQTNIEEEAGKTLIDYKKKIEDFRKGLEAKSKTSKTPSIMPQVDREKFEQEFETFLNSTSGKSKRWLDEEKRDIDKHVESLIRNKKLLLENQAGSNIQGIFQENVFSMGLPGPTDRTKWIIPLTQEMKNFESATIAAEKELEQFQIDVDIVRKLKLHELEFTQQKEKEAPGDAIAARWGTSVEKNVESLNIFIRDQKHAIEALSIRGLLSPDEATKLLTGLDKNAGKDVEKYFDDFNRDILAKQLSMRRYQIDSAEATLDISRSNAARERLVIAQQELKADLETLETLSRMGNAGVEAWNSQMEKIEQLKTKIIELKQTVDETSGSFGEGVSFQMKKFVRDSSSAFEFGTNAVEDVASNMTGFLSSVFDDFRNGEMASWQDYLKNLVNVFAEAAQQILVKMLVLKMIQGIAGAFSGGTPTGADSHFSGMSNTDFASGFDATGKGTDSIGDNFYKDLSGSKLGLRKTSENDFNTRENSTAVVNFNINQPMDAYTFETYVKRNAGQIRKVVSDGVDQSKGYKKKLKGK